MPIPNEDRLRERYDAMLTHNDPHSPYYDGPDGDEEDDGPVCQACGNPIDDCECEEEPNEQDSEAN